jgi:hypothetical protein
MAIRWLQEEGEGDHEMNVEVKVAVGDARTVICHMADKLGADLLVMGSHGYGFFKRYLTVVCSCHTNARSESTAWMNIFYLHAFFACTLGW